VPAPAGGATDTLVPETLTSSGTKCWFCSMVWVTEARLTRWAFVTVAASGEVTVMAAVYDMVAGAAVMVGRGPLNR
jgi:hypothetical protein